MNRPLSGIVLEIADPAELKDDIAKAVFAMLKPLLDDKPATLSADELAAKLGVSRATVDRGRKAGRIPSVMIEGCRRFVLADVLNAAKEKGGTTNA